MYRIAKRLLNRGYTMLDFFACFPGNALGNSDILGECAIPVYAQYLHIATDMGLSGATLVAVTAGYMGFGCDKITRDKFSYFFSHLYDFTSELVPNDTRRLHAVLRPRIPLIDMHIRATDGGRFYLQHH